MGRFPATTGVVVILRRMDDEQQAAQSAPDPDPGTSATAVPSAGDGGNQFGAVLRSPFKWLLYAALTSALGDWVGLVAILALTQAVAGPSRVTLFALSGVMIARVLPTMLLGPVAGVFADRWDRRRLMIATDIGRGVVFLAIPFAQDVWAIFLATLVVEIMATLFIPVKDAVVPLLVPKGHLVQANQLSLMATYGTLPLGGFAFAAVVALAGSLEGWDFLHERPEALALWLNGFTFFLAAWFVSRVPGIGGRPARLSARKEERPGAWEELVEGLRFVTGHPLVRGLVFGVMAAFLAAGVVLAIGVEFARVVNAGSDGFGILQGLVGSGLLLGIIATNWLEPRLGKERVFAPGIGVAGLALVATALMPRLDLAAGPAILMGFGGGVAFLTGYTMLQEYSTDEIRGRTFGAFNTAVRAALFVSLVVAPFVVGVIGPERSVDGTVPYTVGGVRLTLIVAGLLAVAGAVYSGRAVHRALVSAGVDPTAVAKETHGLFVVFEGGDGAGKTTQMELLRDALQRRGIEPVLTREPGGTAVGERIRNVVLDPELPEMGHRAEAMLYAAARAQHVEEVIEPALDADKVVICDRYVDSSIVYQGVGRGLGSDDVRRLNRWGTDNVEPDLVVLLDLPADEGLRRAGKNPDRLEGAGLDFHRRVNEAFRRLALMVPDRYLVVDATRGIDEIHARVRDAVFQNLGLSPHRPPDTAIDEPAASAPSDDTGPDDGSPTDDGAADADGQRRRPGPRELDDQHDDVSRSTP